MKANVANRSNTLLDLFGRLLERPGDDYDDLLIRCRDAAGMRAEAGRFLGQFADRIDDLSLDERRELYDETLAAITAPVVPRANGSLPYVTVLGALDEALQRAGRTPGAASAALLVEHVLPAIERMLPSLESARNPFALLLKAICFAVLDRLRELEAPCKEHA
jgi:hypothetical protein